MQLQPKLNRQIESQIYLLHFSNLATFFNNANHLSLAFYYLRSYPISYNELLGSP